MPDKGVVMSQTHYEKQTSLFKLYQEAFNREEMNVKEAVKALRTLGYCETTAANRVNEWKECFSALEPETDRGKRQRLKKQASLEKYILRISLGAKKYKEYQNLKGEKHERKKPRKKN